MKELFGAVSTLEWILLALSLLALVTSLLAYLRASQALRLASKKPYKPPTLEVEVGPDEEDRPEVALEISAERDEHDQVRLLLRNCGSLPARQLKLTIQAPERIFNSEGLSQGLEQADVSGNSVILPRLAVLDADNLFPLDEILPGNQLILPAVMTMGYGKICDFPVVVKWHDGKNRSQEQQFRITV